MKKLILILLTLLISLKLFAPLGCMTSEDWQKLQKVIVAEQQRNTFILGIQLIETWHDSLSHKYGDPYKAIGITKDLGAFQFKLSTLRWLGYKGTIKNFLNNRELQKEYMFKLTAYNIKILHQKSYRYKITPVYYIGKRKQGIEISLANLAAASHFAGVGNVQKFLAEGYVAKWGSRTIKFYLITFKNYKLETIL
jgi:hypothetical protein